MRDDDDEARAIRLPAAVEGACRHLEKVTAWNAGMFHWTIPGAQAMLDVRNDNSVTLDELFLCRSLDLGRFALLIAFENNELGIRGTNS